MMPKYEVEMVDISAEVFGKYQFCTKAKDGMWYADQDMTYGRVPKRGALPKPWGQPTPELTAKAEELNRIAAERLTAKALRLSKPRRWWMFWR